MLTGSRGQDIYKRQDSSPQLPFTRVDFCIVLQQIVLLTLFGSRHCAKTAGPAVLLSFSTSYDMMGTAHGPRSSRNVLRAFPQPFRAIRKYFLLSNQLSLMLDSDSRAVAFQGTKYEYVHKCRMSVHDRIL